MEQVRGTMPYQCQAPQYNAVKIDIHQPKVQTPKSSCCHGECPQSLYGPKGRNSATMPLPANVVSKKEQPVVEKQTETPAVIDELTPIAVEEEVEQPVEQIVQENM